MAAENERTIEVVIDGKPCMAAAGEYLYDVAKRNGIFIPTLCRHDAFEPRAACRICVCEVIVRGRSKVVTSCCYPIEGPCEVLTASESILEQRRVILMLLQARAPQAEQVAELAHRYNAEVPSDFVVLDNEACILCGLCMQACESLGTGAISTVLRGVEKKVSTPYDKPNEACIGCRSCANVCPTGAIAWHEENGKRVIWQREFTLVSCAHCGEVLGTAEELAWGKKDVSLDEPLCPACQKKKTADALLSAYARNTEK